MPWPTNEPAFRAERFVLSPSIADELERRGQALARVEHHAGGTATLTFVTAADVTVANRDHDDLCQCSECVAERYHWHCWAAHDEGQDECLGCSAHVELDWQRQRLISRLKGRILQLGATLVQSACGDPNEWRLRTPDDDPLHPNGRCSCGGEGQCAWCRSICQLCGYPPHAGECPES